VEIIRTIFQYISPVDLFFIGIIIIFAIRGMFRGFIETIFNAIALIGGVFIGWLLYRPLALQFQKVGILKASELAAFLTLFIAVYLVAKIGEHFFKKVTENKSIDNLDKAAGFIIGALQGAILVILFIIIVVNILDRFFDISSFFDKSYLFTLVEKLFSDMFDNGGTSVV